MTMKKFVCSVCGYLPPLFFLASSCYNFARRYILVLKIFNRRAKCREMMNISWPFDEVASKKQAEDLAEKLVDHKVKRFVCSVCGYTLVAEEANFSPASCSMNFLALQIGHSAGAVSASVVQPHTAHTYFFIIKPPLIYIFLAMARVAHREGYPEIGLYWEKAAYEEAEHAAKFAELLGEVVTPSTEENLKLRASL